MSRQISCAASLNVPFPPERLWEYVTDTNRVDRAVGLPTARFTYRALSEGGEAVTGEYRKAGLTLARWREFPFEWAWPRQYTVVREYSDGPLTRLHTGVELRPVEGGTRIRAFVDMTPRHVAYDPVLRLVVGPRMVRRARDQYRAIAAFLTGRAAHPFPALVKHDATHIGPELDRLMARLRQDGADPVVCDRLRDLLAGGSDEDVAGIRPLELAERWGTDPDQTLETFLRATVLGIFRLDWELLCPSCRGMKARADRLRDLERDGFCRACNLPFTAGIDEAIEARFYPTPASRKLMVGTYCVGSPTKTPHRIAQVRVPPGAARDIIAALEPGPHVLRAPQSRGVARVNIVAGPAPAHSGVTIDMGGFTPAEVELTAGEVTMQVTNAAAVEAVVALDAARWRSQAVTPGRLMTVPAFHELFSAEALAPGVELAIGQVGLLFTDIAHSTALYERAGEGAAFRLVGEHFEVLRAAVEQHGGAVVKTIGDAVMGAFPDGRRALEAALAIQRDIRLLDTRGLADPATLIKIGVHAGPCYAVTLNERLDYFGTTVNLAARAQREARGGEIVVTGQTLHDAEDLLTGAGLEWTSFDCLLRGFEMPIRLCRIDCTRTV